MAENEVRHEGGEGKEEVPGFPVTVDEGLYDRMLAHLSHLESFLKRLEDTEARGGEDMGDTAAGGIALALLRDFVAQVDADYEQLSEFGIGEPRFRTYCHNVPGYEDKAGQVAAVVFGPANATAPAVA